MAKSEQWIPLEAERWVPRLKSMWKYQTEKGWQKLQDAVLRELTESGLDLEISPGEEIWNRFVNAIARREGVSEEDLRDPVVREDFEWFVGGAWKEALRRERLKSKPT
jgi:hypothetical protein